MTTNFEPLWDIVEEHLDEAEFLWEQWEASLVAPNYVLREVEDGPEARLLAHVDGLVVNGPLVAERLLLPTIADIDAEPTRVRAAALALLATPGEQGFAAVLAELHGSPQQRPELARALECCERGALAPWLGPLLDAEEVDLRRAAAQVLAFHGEALAEVVPRMLASEHALDRRLGLRALVRFAGGGRYAREVVQGLAADDPEVRDEALTTAAIFDLPQAWRAARELAAGLDPGAGQALLLLALRGAPEDLATIAAAVEAESLRGAGLWALGFFGTVSAIELAIPWLEDPLHARVAGEVVAAIAGVELEDEELTRAPAEDEALVRRAEDDLPLPDALAVLTWWRKHRARLAAGSRYVAGRSRDAAGLKWALAEGPMRRRAGYLLGLQLGVPIERRAQLEVRAPGRRQRRELAGLL